MVNSRPSRWVSPICAALSGLALLTGCASTPRPPTARIDCQQPHSSCHEGRFGLVYRIERNGDVQEDAVNGTWRWESDRFASVTQPDQGSVQNAGTAPDPTQTAQQAYLELSTVLGTRLAIVDQHGRHLRLTDSKGRQFYSRSWNDLFMTLFELQLPGDSIAQWMGSGANPLKPPVLSANGWQSDPTARRLRLSWRSTNGFIRLDLLPDIQVRPDPSR